MTIFYYYGAKHQSARRYTPPKYRWVVEPFAGAAGYSLYHLQRHNIDGTILIEKDPRVVDLWNRLLLMSPAEVLALIPPAPGEWTDDFLWMTVAASNAIASCRGYSFSKRAAETARSMLVRIAKALPYIQGKVIVHQGDYSSAPDVEATWFIDPPYQPSGPHSLSRGRGYGPGCGSDTIDYDRLAAFCRARRGHVIVCEYEQANWLPFALQHNDWSSNGKPRMELVWEQHPPQRLEPVA